VGGVANVTNQIGICFRCNQAAEVVSNLGFSQGAARLIQETTFGLLLRRLSKAGGADHQMLRISLLIKLENWSRL
jgi:hypothetical protein